MLLLYNFIIYVQGCDFLENKKIFTRRLWAEINMNCIENNFLEIRKKVGRKTKICCVIKADAYGHGAVTLAKKYSELGADFFAVSNLDEAIELRKANIKEPILILGYTPADRVDDLVSLNVSQAVYGYDYAKMLNEEAKKRNIKVKIHIKIDTGMSRIGFMCQKFPRDDASVEEIKKSCRQRYLINEGIFTHFAVADEGKEGRVFTNKQIKAFTYVVEELEKSRIKFKIKHCANSGAIIDYEKAQFDMVRAGIILYGYNPSSNMINKDMDLQIAMRLKTMVSYVKELKKGSTISYGRTFKAERNMKVATVPVGYADGYIRSYAKDAYMLVWNKEKKKHFKAKVLGRICMDQTVIDITDCPFDVEIGNVVVVFGNGKDGEPTAEDVANWGDTICYEVLCNVSKRVPRLYRTNWITGNVVYKI